MRKLIMPALLVLFSINGVASAAEDDVFVIEAEGSYRNILHEPVFMKKALKEACRLGN